MIYQVALLTIAFRNFLAHYLAFGRSLPSVCEYSCFRASNFPLHVDCSP